MASAARPTRLEPTVETATYGRRNRRFAGRGSTWVAIVAVLVLVAVVPGVPSPVGAGGLPAVETGSISGTITGPGDQPLEDVLVFVAGGDYAEAITAADGSYTVEGLVPGYYAVAFASPDGSTLAGEFYDDSYTTPVPVSVSGGEETAGIDAQLEEGATVSGTVTDPDGDPVEDVEIYTALWNSDFYLPGGSRSTTTAADGSYTVTGLVPGYHRVAAYPPEDSPLTRQYYDGVYQYYEAQPVLVAESGTVDDIDLQLEEGGSVSGTVFDPQGDPLGGVDVEIFGESIGEGMITGADGTFSFVGLVPGEYLVSFYPPLASGLLPEFYDNVPNFDQATPIDVDAAEVVTGIDATLEPAGSMSGQVIGLDGTPDSGVQVRIVTPGGDVVRSAFTNFNGDYFLDDLLPGDYIVEFVNPYNTQYHPGTYRRSEATPVTIVGGSTLADIDAEFSAVVLGSQLVANSTTIEAFCGDDDDLTFTFEVAAFDTAGGVTGGSLDFGDSSPAWPFDSTGDTVDHTFPFNGSVSTPPPFDVTLTLAGGAGGTDSVTIVPGFTECRPSVPVFSDVPPSHPFYAAIQWMAHEGITSGFSDGTFRPQGDMVRQGVAAWLYAFAGSPAVAGPQEFSDVPPSHPFYAAIQWMAQEGITSGFSDGTFRPQGDMTRQGVAAWLYAFAGSPTVAGPQEFSDVPPSHAFYAAIQWMAQEGITSGFPNGTFQPQKDMARQGVAAWLYAYDGTLP